MPFTRKEVKIVEQTKTPQPSSSTLSRSTSKLHEDFIVPPIRRTTSKGERDEQGYPIRYYELHYEYDSDDECDYGLKFIPLKRNLRNHPFHPKHTLTLKSIRSLRNLSPCHACGGEMPRDRGYYCGERLCSFSMHVECASLAPTITNDHLPLDYQHPHPLCIFQVINCIFDSTWLCSACGEILGDIFVRCVLCKLNFHLRCNQVQQQLPHSISSATTGMETFHLAVSYNSQYEIPPKCIVCKRQVWLNTHFYQTRKNKSLIEFLFSNLNRPWQFQSTHIGCALSKCEFFKIQLNKKKMITHSTHKKHPLYLHDHFDQIIHCSGCKEPINNNTPTYGCKACHFYLDKSCLNLPSKITHPFHSAHPLSLNASPLLNMSRSSLSCTACCPKIDKAALMYECRDGHKFKLHPKCAFVFKNFCLPDTISDPNCHFHVLKLKPRLVQEDMGEEDQYYCDACEDPRDPNDCLYYCDVCKFEVHVKCVISEVLRVLEQKQDDVKLVRASEILEEELKLKREKEEEARSVEEAKVRNCPTLEQVLCSYMNREDEVEIKKVCKELEAITWGNAFGKSSEFDDSKKLLYSDDSLIKFISKLNPNSISTLEETKRLVFEFLNKQHGREHVVDVREHHVTHNFVTIFEGLLAKNGNFCAGCALSPEMKICFCVIFCDVVHKMCNTSIKDVTEDLLVEWWVRLAMVQSAGFQIQFAFNNFKRVVCAHFGLQADKEADKAITEVCKELHKLPERLKKLKTDLEEGEKRFEELKIKEKELKEASRAKKSRLMRECLLEVEELICDNAGVDLL